MLKLEQSAFPIRWLTLLLATFVPMSMAFGSDADHVAYKFQSYSDNNYVSVITNKIDASKKLGNHVQLHAGYLIDAITGASRKDLRSFVKGDSSGVDAASKASPNIFGFTKGQNGIDGITSASPTDEHRHQFNATISTTFDFIKRLRDDPNNDDPTTLSVTGTYGTEHDYTSTTISAAASQDLFQRNTTIGASYSKSFDKFSPPARFIPGAANEGWIFMGNGERQTDRYSLSVSQGLTVTTILSVTGGYAYDRGYLAKPYYVVNIGDLYYHENLPPARHSYTATARLNQYIPILKSTALHLDYRYYTDSWSMNSHTIAASLYLRLIDQLELRPSYRFYHQSAAFFYQDIYTVPLRYMTTDFKYQTGNTHTVGLKLIWALHDFLKPEDGPAFALYPVSIDAAIDYNIRESTGDPFVRDMHYNYWNVNVGYRAFWLQAGISFAF